MHNLLRTQLRPCSLRLYFLAIVIASCLGYGGSSYAQGSHTTTLQGVSVTLALSKSRITVGEPVTFSITLDNQSAVAMVDLTASFQLAEGNDIDIQVQPPNELPYRYEGAMESGSYSRIPMRLLRGVPRVVEQLLLYDRTQTSGFLFSKPGTYVISGTVRLSLFNNPNFDEAVLPATEVQVVAAEGADAEVLALVDEPELAKGLHLGIAQTTSVARMLEPVAQKYPNTSLGALALRSVGQFYAHADTTDRERGASMLKQYLETGLVPLDADYTAWSIAAAYHLLGQYDLAREWIFYAVRNFPSSVRIRAEDPLYKFYVFDPSAFAVQVPWYLLETPWKIPGAKPPADLRAVPEAQ